MNREQWVLIVFLVLYAVGLIAHVTPFREQLLTFTPVVLLITIVGLLLSIYWENEKANWMLVASAVAVCCFVVEMVGVNTGVIFGEYEYLNNLGIKLWNTPLLIGGNWLLLTIGSYALVQRMKGGRFLKILLAATIMVFIDVLIEGVAPEMNMWQFDGYPPLQNFIAWFIVAFAMLFFWDRLKVQPNLVTKTIIWIQLAFFGGINLISFGLM